MTNLTPNSNFDDVYKLLSTDAVDARNADPMHPQGIANRQAQQLLNRTKWLLDNTPANKNTVINYTGAINTDFNTYQDSGYYAVTSSADYEGSLVVFNNPDISDYSCIQILFLTLKTQSNPTGCFIRALINTTWSIWRAIDDNYLNGYLVDLGTLGGADNGKVLTFDGTKFGVAATSLPTHAIEDHSNAYTGGAIAGMFLRFNNDLNLVPILFRFFDISINTLRETTFTVPSGAYSFSPPTDGTEICDIDQDYDFFPMLMFDIRVTPDNSNYRYLSCWLSSSAITASDAGSTPVNVASPFYQHDATAMWVTKTANKKQLRIWSEGHTILIRSIKGS